MKLELTFKPVVVDTDLISADWEELTQEQVVDYINENWSQLIDPSQPEIDSVSVVAGTTNERSDDRDVSNPVEIQARSDV